MFPGLKAWFSRLSLTIRLNVSILTGVFVCCIGLLFFISHYYLPQIRQRIDDFARFKLQNEIEHVTAPVWATQDAVLTVKNTLKELKTSDVDFFNYLLQSTLKTLSYFEYGEPGSLRAWIYVFPKDNVKIGTLYTGTLDNNNYEFKKQEIKDFYKVYPWFKNVPEKEEFYWSEPYLEERNGKEAWVSADVLPFKFSGSDKYNGLVGVSSDLQNLKQKINKNKYRKFGRTVIFASNGLYVMHPDPDIELKKTVYEVAAAKDLPELKEIGRQMSEGSSGIFKTDVSSVYDDSAISFCSPVPELHWGICLVFTQKEFFMPFKEFHAKALATMFVFLLVLSVFIAWICHRSTKPLLDLSKIALQYGSGDFSAQLPESTSGDEIGVMTNAFHKMRDDLLDHIEMVKEAAADVQKNRSELEIAEDIQQSALPVDFPHNGAFEVYASMKAARQVGGDFYDFFFIGEDKFAVLVADVSGKGIPAALYMMTAKALIKNTAKYGMGISKVFVAVNNELCSGNHNNMFVTAFLAVLNLKTGVLEYVNAGHNPPCYRSADGYKLMDVNHNMVLGGLKDMQYAAQKIQMKKGDRIFLYTDGVTEAENKNGEFYGERRLLNVLDRELQSPKNTVLSVERDLSEFTKDAEQSDDITMLELLYCKDDGSLITAEAEVSSIDKVLKAVRADMKSKHLDDRLQNRVITATEEIFSNIAQYAYDNGGTVHINSELAQGEYILRFSDNGRPYNPLENVIPDTKAGIDERGIGGLGIFIVRNMVSRLEYERTGGRNVLTLAVNLNSTPA